MPAKCIERQTTELNKYCETGNNYQGADKTKREHVKMSSIRNADFKFCMLGGSLSGAVQLYKNSIIALTFSTNTLINICAIKHIRKYCI